MKEGIKLTGAICAIVIVTYFAITTIFGLIAQTNQNTRQIGEIVQYLQKTSKK